MNTLLLILRFLAFLPVIQPRPAENVDKRPIGTSTIVISSCTPGETITIEPGNFRAFVTEDGTAKLNVPAQLEGADPYQITDRRGVSAFNGTAASGQMLTGVCL